MEPLWGPGHLWEAGLGCSHNCSLELRLSLGLDLWPAEPETLGDEGQRRAFPKLGVRDTGKLIGLAAATLWDLELSGGLRASARACMALGWSPASSAGSCASWQSMCSSGMWGLSPERFVSLRLGFLDAMSVPFL